MTLLEALEELLAEWRGAFRRERSFSRAVQVLIGLVCAHGRKTITNSIRARGLQGDWSADYRIFSRAPWNQRDLFRPVLTHASQIHAELTQADAPLVIHVDDTSTPKCARHPSVRWMKDPLSPPFHVNLRRGLRFLHLAVDLPLHRIGLPARAVSVALELVPALKKPGTRASAEEVAAYREMKKTQTIGHAAVARVGALREQLEAQGVHRDVLLVGDGGYTNRTVLTNLPARVRYLGRTRKDVALYAPAPAGGRRIYGERLPTPEQVRQDESIPYRTTRAYFGKAERDVRFKEIRDVLWRNGARRRLLRLLVLAPMPYEGSHKRLYRDPAYLLTTDLDTPPERLIQAYLDRWQIEVIHREAKSAAGLGQAAVWSNRSVERLYSAHVALLALLVLAAHRAFGPTRTEAFEPLPPWRARSPIDRASFEDLAQRLRADVAARGSTAGAPPAPSAGADADLATAA